MVPAAVSVRRLSVDDVKKMIAAGVLDEDDRVELVQGVLLEMGPIGPEHDGAVAWLTKHFARAGSAAWEVRVQSTLLAAGGYLLPDLIVVEPLPRTRHPESALLVIEVAQTSRARDRDKARDFAVADVPEYWIVDLRDRTVTVHRSPLAGQYEDVSIHVDGASVRPLLAGAAPVTVSELLG